MAPRSWAQVNVDGVTMVNNRHAYVNVYPSVDAIQEFKVFTGNAEAEYGGGAGTVTNIQLKTGGNALHGDVFEFFRNTAMDARNFFLVAPLPKQVLKQNQFGATLGGPIIKDRTFFFLSYEGLRSVEQTASTHQCSYPRRGKRRLLSSAAGNPVDESLYRSSPTPTIKFLSIKSRRISPRTTCRCRTPTKTARTTPDVTSGNESVNQYIGRIDHKINDNNQLAFHFIYAFRNFPSADLNPNFTYTGTFPIYNVGLQYVHTFLPTWSMSFVWVPISST